MPAGVQGAVGDDGVDGGQVPHLGEGILVELGKIRRQVGVAAALDGHLADGAPFLGGFGQAVFDGDGAAGDKAFVKVKLPQHVGGEHPVKGVLPPGVAAADADQVDAVAPRQFLDDGEAVGDHGDAHLPQFPGDVKIGGGVVQKDGVPVLDELPGDLGDLGLLRDVDIHAEFGVHQVLHPALDKGAAVGAQQLALLLQYLQVPAYRLRGDVEAFRHLGDGGALFFLDQFHDPLPACGWQHDCVVPLPKGPQGSLLHYTQESRLVSSDFYKNVGLCVFFC